MNKSILLAGFCLPLFLFAQETGIRFDRSASDWQQILRKAKLENKYIFVDCYATWCGPCKYMDREVYPKEYVGDFINKYFVPVKIQLDSTKSDDSLTKSWYYDAHALLTRYTVSVLPTYLFFSPDGKVLHRFSGSQDDSSFLQNANRSLDSSQQFYTLLEKYNRGKLAYKDFPTLAAEVSANGDKRMANEIARDYIAKYLDKLKNEEICAFGNLAPIQIFLDDNLRSGDKVFNVLYRCGDRVDVVLNSRGFSRGVIETIIAKENIYSELLADGKANYKPDWNKFAARIEKRYDKTSAERVVLGVQIKWYSDRKEWPALTESLTKRIEKFGVDTVGTFARLGTNNNIYEWIFKHSNRKEELNTGIRVMAGIVSRMDEDPLPLQAAYIDTYANLLYKIGRIQEALPLEEKAVKLDLQDKSIQQSFEKMKRGLPTWE